MSIKSSIVEQRSWDSHKCSQKWLKCRTKGVLCSRAPKKGVKPRLWGAVRGLHKPRDRLYVVLCLRGGLLGESPALANLRNDRRFIREQYISIGMRPIGEAQSKAMIAYTQSGQYHTIVEISNSSKPTKTAYFSMFLSYLFNYFGYYSIKYCRIYDFVQW